MQFNEEEGWTKAGRLQINSSKTEPRVTTNLLLQNVPIQHLIPVRSKIAVAMEEKVDSGIDRSEDQR